MLYYIMLCYIMLYYIIFYYIIYIYILFYFILLYIHIIIWGYSICITGDCSPIYQVGPAPPKRTLKDPADSVKIGYPQNLMLHHSCSR